LPAISGSGFLIGPSLVLTAAHNAIIFRNGKFCTPSLSEIEFNIIEKEGKNLASSKVKSIQVSLEFLKIMEKINDLKEISIS